MSQKAIEYGPAKMTASSSRSGRISAVFGILSAMVRGGRGKAAQRTGLAVEVAVPRGVGVPTSQPIPSAGIDQWLIR